MSIGSSGQQSWFYEAVQIKAGTTQLVLYRQKQAYSYKRKQEAESGGGSAAAVPLIPYIWPAMKVIVRPLLPPQSPCQRPSVRTHYPRSYLCQLLDFSAIYSFLLFHLNICTHRLGPLNCPLIWENKIGPHNATLPKQKGHTFRVCSNCHCGSCFHSVSSRLIKG